MKKIDNKIINLVKDRKEKTPLVLEKKEKVDNRTIIEIIEQEYDFKVGDMFIGTTTNKWFEFYKISNILTVDPKGNKLSAEDTCIELALAYYKEDIYNGHINVFDIVNDNIDLEKIEWCHYSSYSAFKDKGHYNSLHYEVSQGRLTRIKSLEELKNYVQEFENNIKDFSKFDLANSEKSDETALAVMDQNLLTSMQRLYDNKRNEIQLLQAVAKYKMEQLENIKNKFITIVQKIHRVIGKIELYLGVNEDIVQIQEGSAAPANTPISLFQKILYMDEEVGAVEDGGLDWKHIDDFDNWLIDGHLDLIAPLPKCIVILRVRRQDKYYSSIRWVNDKLNAPNKYTYFLIRNGDKVYRIYAELTINPRLFPKLDEIKDNEEKTFSNKELIDDYHNHFLVIQGIIDRSDMLWPLPHKVDIFNSETWNGLIQLVRDDELTLPDGHLPYEEWKEELNSHNKVGSRIVYSGLHWRKEKEDRIRGGSKWSESPSIGIYNIKRYEDNTKNCLIIWYNPKDTVYDWNKYWLGHAHTRKKSIAFMLYNNEDCVLNYDYIKIEDLDFYINCRQEREHYLELIPLLKQLKKIKLKELEEEKAFKALLFVQLKLERSEKNEKIIDNTIEWWKFKVKEKRPLIREDVKALRMIKSKVKKEL